MNTSEQISEFAKAMAAAQVEIANPVKNAENPHFKSSYVDLAGGLNEVRPILASHGIAILQSTFAENDYMMLTTRLLHTSGQWIESVYPVCKFPARQQEIGSALTYARRYSLFALAGIAGADDDDDGNEASKEKTPAPPKKVQAPKLPNMEHMAYAADFRTELANATRTDEIRDLWKLQRVARERMGLADTDPLAGELHKEWLARGLELKSQEKKEAA